MTANLYYTLAVVWAQALSAVSAATAFVKLAIK